MEMTVRYECGGIQERVISMIDRVYGRRWYGRQ